MLDKLIAEGERIKPIALQKGHGQWMSGEEYESWIAQCIYYVDKYCDSPKLRERFFEAANKAVGNPPSYYEKIMGVLKALKELQERGEIEK